MTEITKGKIRYTIEAIVEYDATEPQDLEYLLDEIRQYGEAKVIRVETIKEKK